MIEDRKRVKLPQCFYCGDDTQRVVRDHVVPVSSKGMPRTYDYRDTVDCCTECNSMLGSVNITTVEERAAYIAGRLCHKYKNEINAPRWTEDEIEDMGPNMASMIKANMLMKEYISRRLSCLSEISMSLYNSEDVAHLRGIVTMDKKTAYRIISSFMTSPSGIKPFILEQQQDTGWDPSRIENVILEKDFVDVAITYKYERRFPMDMPLKAIKQSIRRQKIL
jgi:hypothetical protein